MNTVATVDKNLRLALKAAKAAAAAQAAGMVPIYLRETGREREEGDFELAHNHTHTQSQF